MALNGGRARVRSRARRVAGAGGWGLESLSECDAWVAAIAAGKRWRAVALSTRRCLLPIVSAQRAQDMAGGRSEQAAASGRIKGRAGQGRAWAVVRTSLALVEW